MTERVLHLSLKREYSDEIAGRMKLCNAAREALRSHLAKDRT